jgi:zinc protease
MELPGVASPISNVVMKKLATGLTVIVARRRAASATAWLGFHGGYSDIDPPLVVELALRARPEAVAAAKYGALAGRGATRDASLETLEFRAADLEQALALLFAKATTPIQKWPPREGLERLVASVNADVDAASARANGAFWRALFGDHPFARVLTAADLARVTRADVDAWIGRVHNVRNAVLIVVGDVNVEDVSRYATELSQKVGAPAWVDAVPPVAPPPLRPATAEHVTTVVTSRPGALTDVRLGCLLPPMAAKDRADFETLRLAMQERLSSALRVERGEGYGVDVSYEWLRGGTAFLQVLTFLDAGSLPEALATLRQQWRRWAGTGFDAGEINVARWQYGGELSLASLSGHGIAYHLFNDWNADPAAAGRDTFRVDVMSTTAARLRELFATCQANAVLALTGNEPAIRNALGRSWPEQ